METLENRENNANSQVSPLEIHIPLGFWIALGIIGIIAVVLAIIMFVKFHIENVRKMSAPSVISAVNNGYRISECPHRV